MTQRSRVQIVEDMTERLPTNDRGLITAAVLRNQLTDVIDSVVFIDEHQDTPGSVASPRLSVLTLTSSTALTTADHINKLLIFDSTADLTFTLPNNAVEGDWVKVRRANTGNVAWELATGALLENPASKNTHTRLGERFSMLTVTCLRNEGGSNAIWTMEGETQSSAPPVEDTDPDQFLFTDVTGAEVGTIYVSNIITVAGIGAASPISITGASAAYSINGGPYVASSGTVDNGDVVRVRVTSSASYETAVSAVLTIGTVSDTYTVVTKVEVLPDTTPDAFDFADVSNATVSTDYISNTITVSGINAGAAITVTGGSYSRNGAAFTTNPGTAFNGDSIRARATSSSSGGTATTVQVTIGGVVGTYVVTTAVPVDTTPDAFGGPWVTQTDVQANTVYTSPPSQITGINGPSPISITGGSYSVNNGAYTTANGTVLVNDVVRVRVTSAATGSTSTTATVTIGGVTGTFMVTTAAGAGSGTGIDIDEGMWKITIPLDSSGGTSGVAREIWPPEILTLDEPAYFDRQSDGSIIFIAPVDGARTSGSSYSRSELREILPDGSDEYEWNIDTGGKLEATCAILELPTLTAGSQNRVIIGQIHGPNDEMCRLYYWAGGKLSFYNDKAITTSLNTTELEFVLTSSSGAQTTIPLGAFFDYTIEADRDEVKVTVVYNGTTYTARAAHSSFWTTPTLPLLYFKAGAYNAVGISSGSSTNRGTGRSRVHFKRIIAPVHPHAQIPVGTPPSGLIWPSQVNPVTYTRSVLVAWGYHNINSHTYGRWMVTGPREAHSWVTPDNNEIRFEIRSGDHYAEGGWSDPITSERNELGMYNQIPWQNPLVYEWESKFTGLTNTAPWCVLHQSFAEGAGGSPPFAIGLEPGDDLVIITRTDTSGSTVETYRYNQPITRNTYHRFRVELRMGRSNNAYLRVWLNGTQIVNVSNVNIGYSGQTGISPYWGVYRSEAPETLIHYVRNMRMSTT